MRRLKHGIVCFVLLLLCQFAVPPKAQAQVAVEDFLNWVENALQVIQQAYEIYQKYMQLYNDYQRYATMLKNLEQDRGKVEFNAPLVVAAPTYNIIDELKEEGDWDILQKYSGFEFDDNAPKTAARTEYQNMMYLERPGCNLCMGTQEKAEKGDTVMATSTRLFQGRVVEDSERKKGESLLSSTPVVVLSAVLGRTPSLEEYKTAVEGIDLTTFAPPVKELVAL